jgi:propanol-preferring alcohol dehydrogenase
VLAAVDVTCGRCRHCLTGDTQRCPDLSRLGFERDGGHAEFVVVPSGNLISLPPGLSPQDACILPDATACMWHALVGLANIGPRDRLLILGAGGLGLHGIQIARLAGAEVMATSRKPPRREAAENFGAVAIDPSTGDLTAAVDDFTTHEGLDIVADCVGTKESVREGLSLLRPGGTLLVIAYLDEYLDFESLTFFSREKRIVGCRGTNRAELHTVVDLTARGLLTPVIGARYPLSGVNEAAERLDQGDLVGRIVLTR